MYFLKCDSYLVCASIQPLFLKWGKLVICSNVVFYSELCAVLNLATSVAAQFNPVRNSTSFITRWPAREASKT